MTCSLITLYQLIHDAIHGKSGQTDLLKLQYIRSDSEAVMGWVRPSVISSLELILTVRHVVYR